jgi:hypothetical protein
MYVDTSIADPLLATHPFVRRTPRHAPVPSFEQARALLPEPIWPAQAAHVECYWGAWRLAFQNVRSPAAENGFVSSYIDAAFNGSLFMWDSAFITLYARYARRAFDFVSALDNFYVKQHADGFICREIRARDGGDQFARHDPSSTGPNLLPWTEWQCFTATGDRQRLRDVFVPLLSYYRWFRENRSWPDGSYFASGWGSGMDNQPRLRQPGADHRFSHGFQSWVDTCFQQLLASEVLLSMAELIGDAVDVSDLRQEQAELTSWVNRWLWNESVDLYTDRFRDGRQSEVKTIGAYWALLTRAVDSSRAERMCRLLEDPALFGRPHPVPTLAADHPEYSAAGNYWCGGVWPPTTMMVLEGLVAHHFGALARRLARAHLESVTRVWQATGTLWENYAPERDAPGDPARPDFVGWSGLGPIVVLLEHVFGLRFDAARSELTWHVDLLDEHGVRRYPIAGGDQADLWCPARQHAGERPRVQVRSSVPVRVLLHWAGGSQRFESDPL